MKNARKIEMLSVIIANYQLAKPLLRLRLVNRRLDSKKVDGHPHISYLDLEIIFYLKVVRDSENVLSIPVTDQMFQKWGISLDDAYQDALGNTRAESPATIRPIDVVLADILKEIQGIDGMAEVPEQQNIGLYVVSSRDGMFGAASVLYPGVLKECEKMFGGDFWIIPCSVHEVLVCSAEVVDNADDLAQIIQTVNQNEVKAQDVLSDHPYLYVAASEEGEETAEILM